MLVASAPRPAGMQHKMCSLDDLLLELRGGAAASGTFVFWVVFGLHGAV